MAEPTNTEAQERPAKRNKDGFVPGQRVSPQELAKYRNKARKAGK